MAITTREQLEAIGRMAGELYTSSGVIYAMTPETLAQVSEGNRWVELVSSDNLEGAHGLVALYGGSVLREPSSGKYSVETVAKWANREAAEVGTDTATILAISPEALYDLMNEGEWHDAADAMWGDSPHPGGGGPWFTMMRLIREHGGAYFNTGGDGGWEVTVSGGPGELDKTIEGEGTLPPYGTSDYGRVAARHQMAEVVSRMKTAGWWAIETDTGSDAHGEDTGAYLGDAPLDARIEFLEKMDEMYRRVWNRPIKLIELEAIMEVPPWTDDSHLWPMNKWVDVAAEHMGTDQTTVLLLPEASLKDARRLWRDYRNSGIQIGVPIALKDGGFPEPTEESLIHFLDHIRASFSLHFADSAAFIDGTPPENLSSWAKESSMPLSNTLAARVARRHIAESEGNTTDYSDSVGLFIPLSKELADQYPSLGDEDTSPSHVTLLYVGTVTPDREEEFLDIVAEVLGSEPGPVRAWTDGVDKFVHPAKDREVFFTPIRFSRDLGMVRDKLTSVLTDAGFDIKNSFPLAFSPHTTLAYADGIDQVWDGPVPSGAWEFEGVEVWGLPDKHTLSFGEYDRHELTFLEQQRAGLLNAWGDYLE